MFGRSDAPVIIGVGKNMVRSIRFWGLAAKLLVEDPEAPNRRSPGLVPTRVGHALFGEMGWDPFMEDPGTLWLLHWLLDGTTFEAAGLVAGVQRLRRGRVRGQRSRSCC